MAYTFFALSLPSWPQHPSTHGFSQVPKWMQTHGKVINEMGYSTTFANVHSLFSPDIPDQHQFSQQCSILITPFFPFLCREALELQLESCFKEVAHPMIRQNPEFLTTFKSPRFWGIWAWWDWRLWDASHMRGFSTDVSFWADFAAMHFHVLAWLWLELAEQSERQVCSTFVHIIQVRRYACQPNLKRVSNCQDMKLLSPKQEKKGAMTNDHQFSVTVGLQPWLKTRCLWCPATLTSCTEKLGRIPVVHAGHLPSALSPSEWCRRHRDLQNVCLKRCTVAPLWLTILVFRRLRWSFNTNTSLAEETGLFSDQRISKQNLCLDKWDSKMLLEPPWSQWLYLAWPKPSSCRCWYSIDNSSSRVFLACQI